MLSQGGLSQHLYWLQSNLECIALAPEVCPPAAELFDLSLVTIRKQVDVGVEVEVLAHLVEYGAVELVRFGIWVP